MMKAGKLHIIAMALLAAAACSKTYTETGNTLTQLRVSAQIEPATKAPISGTSFPEGSTFSFFVCKHESGTPANFEVYYRNYDNVLAVKDSLFSDGWKYAYKNSTSDFMEKFFIVEDGLNSADVYAVAPWMSGNTRPDNIPYSLYTDGYHNASDQRDLMWATQNAAADRTTGNFNIEINYVEHSLSFTFRHVLSRIRIGMRQAQGSETLNTLTSVVIKKVGSGSTTTLYESGTFNAVDGTFSSKSSVDSLRLNMSTTLSTDNSFAYTDLLVFPTEVEDDELMFVFYFNGARCTQTYTLRAADVLHSDNSTKGFRPGSTYTFNFTFNNYVRFDSVTIEDGWTTGAGREYLW